MKDLEELKNIIRLKEIYRTGVVKDRHESDAEHSWACMALAEYFLKRVEEPLDELKVLKLLLYHDVIELETGDVDALDEAKRLGKSEREMDGSKVLAKKLPQDLSDEFVSLFDEYEKGVTPESKFCRAIDDLEPMIHWAVYAPDWKGRGWTESKLREKKHAHLVHFPVMLDFFEDMVKELKKKGNI